VGEGTVNEDEKKTDETEVTPEGAVEVQEEDLDKASGGAGYIKSPIPEKHLNPTLDPVLKQSPTLNPTDRNYDL
jgi:hypothetical protein